MANGQGEFSVKLNRSHPSCWYCHNFYLLFLSTGQYWSHLLEYQWSNDSDDGVSIQPYLSSGGDVNISSLPQLLYLPSQLGHESPQPGPLGFSSSAPSSRASPETVSQSSEDSVDEPIAVARWSRADVLLLISCYAERRERFKDINTKNKILWEEISQALQKKGVFFTSKSCETKMKYLKRSYLACVDHNKVSGNDPKKYNFYDELHEIFSRDDAIQPKTLCSNLDGPVKRSKEAVKRDEISNSTGSDLEEPPVVK